MAKKSKAAEIKANSAQRIKRTEAYAEKVRREFALTANQMLALNKKITELEEGEMFSFDALSVKKQKQVELMLRRLHSSTLAAVKSGIQTEWNLANEETDKLISSYFGKRVLSNPAFAGWMSRNEAAMDAFIARSNNGMNLSDRVWKPVRQLRDEMEVALTVSIGEGESASTISRRVRQYLNDPDLMFRRFRYKDEDGEWQRKWKKKVRDDDGKVKWIDYDKDSYKDDYTGKGYYKSSARNAMRLARTETNMAYRNADHERWQQLDFVLGQHVLLSNKHPEEDICNTLSGVNEEDERGRYPKTFRFEGWHPQCFCYVVPIMVSEDEMEKMSQKFLNGEVYKPKGEIIDYNDDFKCWVKDNKDKIETSLLNGKAPYFISHNENAVKELLAPAKKNVDEIEQVLGIKKGDPMSFKEANELKGNPKYAMHYIYKVNCQSAVVANELRRRGYDVEAFGNTTMRNTSPYALSMFTEAAWVDAYGNIPVSTRISRLKKGEKSETIRKRMQDSMAEVGRYHVKWSWKGGKSGHIITAERLPDGTLRFYDPQTGKIGWNFDTKGIDGNIGYSVLRVDTLKPRIDVIRGVVKKALNNSFTPMMDETQKNFWRSIGRGNAVYGEQRRSKNQLAKAVKNSGRFPTIKDEEVLNLQSKKLKRSKDALDAFFSHIWIDEFKIAEHIWNNPQKLSFVRVSPLGEVKDMDNPKDVKNIERKIAKGVEKYNVYSICFRKKEWLVKLEQYKDGYERIYSIERKK